MIHVIRTFAFLCLGAAVVTAITALAVLFLGVGDITSVLFSLLLFVLNFLAVAASVLIFTWRYLRGAGEPVTTRALAHGWLLRMRLTGGLVLSELGLLSTR